MLKVVGDDFMFKLKKNLDYGIQAHRE